jgi:hypothetical protein
LNLNPKIQAKKGLIIYNTTNGILIELYKHVNLDHFNKILNVFYKSNSPLRENERQLSKKKPNMFSNSISNFFITQEPFKKYDLQQKQFLENLGFLIVKTHLPFTVCGKKLVENIKYALVSKFFFLPKNNFLMNHYLD